MLGKRSTILVITTLVLSMFFVTSIVCAESGDIPGAEYYTGTASGYSGSVRVTIAVLDGEIVDVSAEGKSETQGIGTAAVDQMQAAMLEARSWDVDGMSGATITSDAMREAAKKAMTEAGLLDDTDESTPMTESAPESASPPASEPNAESTPEPESAPESTSPPVSESGAGEAGGTSYTWLIVAAVVAVVAVVIISRNKKK